MRRAAVAASALLLLVAACGDDDDVAETGAAPTTTEAPEATTTSAAEATTTTAPEGEAVDAIWPAADVVFATPEEAAEDFVSTVLGVTPTLGEFQQGDARSGEIALFSPGEGGGSRIERSTLGLRQLGPDDGWFVLFADNPVQQVTGFESGASFADGPITVDGSGRGFEGAIVVELWRAGDGEPLDQAVTQGGSFADAAPFTVELDASAAADDELLFVVVRGGVGLEEDPGELTTFPIRLAGP